MEIKLQNTENNIFTLIKDEHNHISFCPDRGGLITDWTYNGKKILYFDQNRFKNQNLSIRGGIPILFPICGSCDQNSSIFGSNYEKLPQHGFARDLSWNFEFNKEKGSLTLSLKNNQFTKKYYPFLFELKMNVIFKLNSLIYEIEVFNNSNKQMPINFGLHPYFNISDFKNIQFEDYPLVCLDQKTNKLELTASSLCEIHKGIDLLIYSKGSLSLKDNVFRRKIILSNPYPFDINVIWSDPPRKMICMEPWTSPRNSFINGFRKIFIPSKNSKNLKASIKIDDI